MNTTVHARTLRSRLADLSQSMRNDTTIGSIPAKDHSRIEMEHVLEVLRNKSAIYAQRPTEARLGDPLIPSILEGSFDDSSLSHVALREPESPVMGAALRGARGFHGQPLNHMSRSIREISGSPSPSSSVHSQDDALFHRKERARVELQLKQKEILELHALDSPRRYMADQRESAMLTLQSMEIARSSVSSLTEMIKMKEQEIADKKSQYTDQRRTLVDQRRALLEQEMQLKQLEYLQQLEEEESALAQKSETTKKLSDSLSNKIRSHSALIERLQSNSTSPVTLTPPPVAATSPVVITPPVTPGKPLAISLATPDQHTHSAKGLMSGGPEMYAIGTPGGVQEGPEPSPYMAKREEGPSPFTHMMMGSPLDTIMFMPSPIADSSGQEASPFTNMLMASPVSVFPAELGDQRHALTEGADGSLFTNMASPVGHDSTGVVSPNGSGILFSPAVLVDDPCDSDPETSPVGRTELVSPVWLAQFSPPMDGSPPHVMSDDITIMPQCSPIGSLELVDFTTGKTSTMEQHTEEVSGEFFVEDLLAGKLSDLKTPPKPNRLFRRSTGSDDLDTVEVGKTVPPLESPGEVCEDAVVEHDFLTMTRLASDDNAEDVITDALLDSLIETVIAESYVLGASAVSSPRSPSPAPVQQWRLPTRFDAFDLPATVEDVSTDSVVSVDAVVSAITAAVCKRLHVDVCDALDDSQIATIGMIDFMPSLEQIPGLGDSMAMCVADAFIDLLSSLPPAAAANKAWAAKCPGGVNPLAAFLPIRHSLQSLLAQLKSLIAVHADTASDETERVDAVCKQFLWKFNLDEAAFQCNVAQFRVDEDAEAAQLKDEILAEVDEFILEAVMTSVAGDFFLPTQAVLAS